MKKIGQFFKAIGLSAKSLFRIIFRNPEMPLSPELIRWAQEATRVVEIVKKFVDSPVLDILTQITPTGADDMILKITRETMRELWEEIVPPRKDLFTARGSERLAYQPPVKVLKQLTEKEQTEIYQTLQNRLFDRYTQYRGQALTAEQRAKIFEQLSKQA